MLEEVARISTSRSFLRAGMRLSDNDEKPVDVDDLTASVVEAKSIVSL